MNLPNVLAILVLVVGVPLNLLVTWRLLSRSRAAPRLLVLRERLITAVAVLILVIVFALIFFNNDQMPPWLSTDITKLVTRAVMLGVAIIPALYWLYLYRDAE